MCEKLPFFHNPRGGQKRHFFAQFFFSLNIDSDHRSVHLGWFIWVFWEFMMKKMINFLAQRHIKVFLEFKLFWILNFLVQITPTAIWECISWIPGFNGKMRRNKNDFFLEVWCVKNYHFFTARGGQKRHFFAIFFFFWISILITGRCIWGGLFVFFENLWWKNDKFSSTMTY